jgi:polyferredoxin
VKRFDLLRLPLLKPLLVSRWPQFLAAVVALAGFILAITAGFLGSPVGSRSFAIIFVWIAWWALLMLIAVPFLGRAWCSICPIPMPGDWLQRGAVLSPGEHGQGGKNSEGKRRGLNFGLRWPNKLRGIWLQNAAFALVALFSTVVLTQPAITSAVLLLFLFLAVGASIVFERRAFCRYLCPVGGFIGLYSQLAPIELRVIDRKVCADHTEKTCYTGSTDGYGCPWQVFPGGLVKNTYCGMCMECLRTCPHDNIALNLRAFGDDLSRSHHRKLDEVYKSFIMLGSAVLYSAVLLGPWGQLKLAAYSVGSLPWAAYAVSFLLVTLGVLPGLYYLAVLLGKRLAKSALPARTAFISMAYALVPLGLAAWAAFSLSFVFANFSYVWVSLSDPFGWGWDLFGTAHTPWQPYLMEYIPFLQVGVLLVGLAWSARTAYRLAGEKLKGAAAVLQTLPSALYSLGLTVVLLWLLVG